MPAAAPQATECVPAGRWVALDRAGTRPVAAPDLYARAARQSVVLLGETHESADDHRWQLQALAALHALRPDMTLAFEMFPRRAQPVLDRWVAGELSETEFLGAVDWRKVWNVDAQLYLPLFHFARMNRVPMLALNVERELIRDISARGLDAVPADRREGVTRPARPSEAYVDFLLGVYAQHERTGSNAGKADRNDPAFRRFVESQQFWDRAMAQGIAAAAARRPAPLVVGILGKGHVQNGFGVPSQLKDLDVAAVVSLLPWERGSDCGALAGGYADAVFGVAPAPKSPAPPRPRLGVQIEQAEDGVRIREVEKGSIAEAAGLRGGDIVSEVAGRPSKLSEDLIVAVQRQAPGTWLPLKVRRGGDTLDVVAKFPPAAK